MLRLIILVNGVVILKLHSLSKRGQIGSKSHIGKGAGRSNPRLNYNEPNEKLTCIFQVKVYESLEANSSVSEGGGIATHTYIHN